jgi:PAS domain S-box-containing protein
MGIDTAYQEIQARLTGIIASAMDAIITINDNQRIVQFNAAAENMFGYPTEEVVGRPLEQLIPERYRSRHREHIRQFGKTGVTNRAMGRLGTLYGLRSNGDEFPIEASISQIKTDTGNLYTVILRDVTERVEAEDKLIESEQQLRATFEQAAVGITHLAPDGQVRIANDRFCAILGYSSEELQTLTSQDITHPEDLPNDLSRNAQILKGEIQSYSLEKRFIRKDGLPVWVNLTASLVRDKTGEPRYTINVIEDITERKKAEDALRARTDEIKTMTQQLWQTAKLATMGELAASIAHELNNPLAILSLRIESLLEHSSKSDPARRELMVMEVEVDRMASLVSNLLQFSRSGQRQVSTLDVREEIEKTLELVQNHLTNRKIMVEGEFSPSIPIIQADRQQLRQLFLNLFSNAADALPDGGTLAIRIAPLDQNQWIRIDIQDNGIGIEAEYLSQVMDPFFTTKLEGKGTGLGLAICRRIVEEHNGSIKIISPGLNQGTQIQILLPGEQSVKPIIIE